MNAKIRIKKVLMVKMDLGHAAEAIAAIYTNKLADQLTKQEWSAICSGKAVPDDFCDGNMVMLDAMTEYGVDMSGNIGDDDAIVDLWNTAYAIALRKLQG